MSFAENTMDRDNARFKRRCENIPAVTEHSPAGGGLPHWSEPFFNLCFKVFHAAFNLRRSRSLFRNSLFLVRLFIIRLVAAPLPQIQYSIFASVRLRFQRSTVNG
jgi:hypothetical protein